jgi:hypothetical protein
MLSPATREDSISRDFSFIARTESTTLSSRGALLSTSCMAVVVALDVFACRRAEVLMCRGVDSCNNRNEAEREEDVVVRWTVGVSYFFCLTRR